MRGFSRDSAAYFMTLFRTRSALITGLFALFLCFAAVVFGGHAATAAGATHAAAGHASGGAAGNGSSSTGKSEALLVAEVLLLLTVGRVLGEVMQRIGQPPLMGQLLAGIVLGPSLFGWLWPQAHHFLFPSDPEQKRMIDGISQVGILMLLLLTGMETDLKLVRKSGFAAVIIAICGIVFPFAC